MPATLDDACGDEPSYLCERVYDLTDGNDDLTKLIDWLLAQSVD